MLALALWPFVLTGVLARLGPLRAAAGASPTPRRRAPGRCSPLTALAVVTHPALDWLNNYGLRWLMPFDGALVLRRRAVRHRPVVLAAARRRRVPDVLEEPARARALDRVLRCSAIVSLIFANAALVPVPSAVLWVAGVAALVAARWRLRDAPPAVLERAAQAGLALAAVYIVAMLGSQRGRARRRARRPPPRKASQPRTSWSRRHPPIRFGGDVVVMTRDEYYVGSFRLAR